MSRVKDAEIIRVLDAIGPALAARLEASGQTLGPDDVWAAIVEARQAGIQVRRLTSRRSVAMVLDHYIANTN